MTRFTTKKILKEIGCDKLDLWKAGEGDRGYWVFQYDDPALKIYDTSSIMTPRLSDMTLEQWVTEGKGFVEHMEGEDYRRSAVSTTFLRKFEKKESGDG